MSTDLTIRDDDGVSVTVADTATGYAVAQFFYQVGADGKPKFDARKLAEQFCDQVSERQGVLSDEQIRDYWIEMLRAEGGVTGHSSIYYAVKLVRWAMEQQTEAKYEGAALIVAERRRQVADEGWTPEHDDTHVGNELAVAAACYAYPPERPDWVKRAWPWDRRWWKPTPDDRIRELVKAGALIAAEIDRLQRAELAR